VTDRWSAYDWIAGASRQVCWSHPRRDFQAMIDSGGPAEPIGRKLLRRSDRLFRWWHRLGAEGVDCARFGAAMARLRREVRAAPEDGVRCDCATTRGSCAEILRLEESLWTFARVRGVPPENNAAERAERHAVIWRRISGGTDSAGEPVRGADVDGGGHVPAARPGRAGLPDILLRSGSARSSDPLPLPSDSTEDQSRLIPAVAPYERLRQS
jgi:hypothetical protein